MVTGPELRELFAGPPRWTLAVAESITCGQLQAALGAISGASDFFVGGLTAYDLEQKVRHLAVDRDTALACNGVSAEVARQMARGALHFFGSDFAAATTGYAEPANARGYPHPAAYWAVAHAVGAGAEVVREGFFERSNLARVAMQQAVAVEVMAAIEAAVRAARTK